MRATQGLFCAAVLVAVVGCGEREGTTPSPPFETARSDKSRDTTPDVPPSDLAELVTGNTEFAFDLYGSVRDQSGNLFYSPYSISLALVMTWAGARGNTELEMAQALHFTLGQDRLHPAMNALDLELESRGEAAEGADGEGFRLNIANSIWGQVGYEFLDPFLDCLAVNYGAGLNLLDFIAEPEPSRVTINDWVAQQTEQRIKDLIPQGAITEYTRLVLTNAIYFNAAWLYPFEESETTDGVFTLLGGGEVTVPTMQQTEMHGYAQGSGWQAVELLYDGMELSMVIFVPEAGGFEAFETSLDAAKAQSILGSLATTNVALTMPKFTFEGPLNLKAILAGMGMVDAFDASKADFSGVDGTRYLFIGGILHKAFVSVNEAGTEAAAATAVIMGTTSVPPPPVEVTIDRPFVFMIRDIPTGVILFVGRVVDPGA